MKEVRPYALSIAGFDPSGGAGALADVKTFELHKTIGFGACTAITFQNDIDFQGVSWISPKDIKKQVDILYRREIIDWVKIGLIQDLTVLEDIILYLIDLNPRVNIIWDPILKASAGFVFHNEVNQELLFSIMKHLFLITPNLGEVLKLVPDAVEEQAAMTLSNYCNVLLKGGHRKGGIAVDALYEKGDITYFEGKMIDGNKHGTGCVLSAAVLANLALGMSLKEACKEGKEYINGFILSNTSSLGYHYV